MDIVAWMGAIGGITGALLVAFKRIEGRYVWTISNAVWILWGIKTQNWALAVQFAVFLIVAIIGIAQWRKQ